MQKKHSISIRNLQNKILLKLNLRLGNYIMKVKEYLKIKAKLYIGGQNLLDRDMKNLKRH